MRAPSNVPGMLYVVHPQAPVSRAPPILFSITPVCTRAQPTLPRPYVEPLMFTFQGPKHQSEIAYVTPYSFTQPPKYDLSMEQENVLKNPEQEEMARMMKSLEQILKNMQDDLARDFVRQFQYNVDIALDKNSLSNLKKKTAENFHEYAVKLSEQAPKAQEADYFQNIMSSMGKPFHEAIKIGEMVENGLEKDRILSHAAFKATSQSTQIGSEGLMNRNGSEEGAIMAIAAIAEIEEKPKDGRQA
uniref:Uncharacterized protein LOC104226274 n=1 Tax=Nicotiana sylvestris TaxID=4096 RepID=A0A1U7WQK2_NICSY|nr:PREDICTED: uncharacterized protein LOC104226274 [Nicotiana sylvestris]